MMSHRGKRQALSRSDDITPVATKRRKGRPSATAEEEEASPLEQKSLYSSNSHLSSDIKMSSIYNRSVTDAPAELFRKDLISAMKLPDSEPLTSDHYWVITDQWKQEWERGVQVPVKPDSLPGPVVHLANTGVSSTKKIHLEFKLPKNKYIRITKDEHFRVDDHYLSNVGIQAEKCCAYDLEDVDVVWLNIFNGERALLGLTPINQDQLERVIEELEMRCWDKVHAIVKKEEGLALEFDESVICDVCRSPDSEDGNEMVFCDCCNICVHQACYGITSIPSGSWLCRTCALSLRPECVLCPNKNGAMKSTRNGDKWAHVSCALWIPEVSIGCVEKMEPITKISSIPQSRWALICVLCRERVGACIQCSVKTCKTAYHVTCAFKYGLEMRAIIDEESTADDDNTVKLRSYCQKHSISCKKENTGVSGSASDEDVKKKQRKDMTTEEKSHARALKLQEIEAEFEKHVTIKDINRKYDVDPEGLEYIYNYWVLKRRAAFNKPLLAARSEDASDLLNKNQEQVDQEKMRMFVQLRQDLERVRNLCYMVSRREKLSRTYQRYREQTFYTQAALLSDTKINLSTTEINSIKEANHGPSIYDRLYSHANAPDLSTDFETMVHRIAGRSDSELSPGHSVNGYVSGKNGKRSCFNGDFGRSNRSFLESMSSGTSDIDSKSHVSLDTEFDTRIKVNNRMNKSQRKNSVENRNKNTARRRKKIGSSSSLYSDSTSSSDDEDGKNDSGSKSSQKHKKNFSKKATAATSWPSSFDPLERRILSSRSASVTPAEEDDSDHELKLLRRKTKSGFKKSVVPKIYSSDSDSSCSARNSDAEAKSTDNKQIRTKASMKEFSADGSAHRSSKDRAGSNGISKSVSFLSSSSKNTNVAAEKHRRVDKLFDEESDEDKAEHKRIDQDDSDNDVFLPQRKSTKMVNESTNRSKSRKVEKSDREKKSPVIDNIMKKNSRKESAKDDIFSLEVNAEKINNSNSANYDMLTLVPQRAAAKKAIKAIEHIKNGMVKPTATFEDVDDAMKACKSMKMSSKKEQSLILTSKHKSSTDVDESKVNVEKRTQPKLTSTISTIASSDNTNSSQISVANSDSVTINVTTTCSSSVSHLTNTVASPAPTIVPVVSATEAVKKSSTSSSSSSSYSSSSSSSSSDSSSSGETSSSSNSSSSSGSSSSSSESEAEDDSKSNILVKKPTVPLSAVSSISVNAPAPGDIPKLTADRDECGAESTGDEKNSSLTLPCDDDREEIKPSLSLLNIMSNERKSPPPLPEPILKASTENYSITDQSSFASDVMKIVDDEDVNEKHNGSSPLLPSLPNRSLFSPQLIKDIDLSSFDDLNENNNMTDSSSMSLLSLTPLTFDGGFAFKEDSKEDSARETKNLVEKLKQEMARKKNNGGDTLDSMASAPTPDVVLNHLADDEDEDKILSHENMDVQETKKDDSTSSDNYAQQQAMNISSDSSLLLAEIDPSVKITPSMTFPSDEVIMLPKESPQLSESQSVTLPSNDRQFDEGNQSPYTQELANVPDRWSESVMLPSRRSDCSSISVSSRSSSSSTYSEHNQQTSHNEEMPRLEPALEISNHLQKSVVDLLRPTDNHFTAGTPMSENIYSYDDHLPFVKSSFNSTAPSAPDDKTVYGHDSSQVSQSPSMFSTSINYDSVSAFNNSTSLINSAFGQPLSIQPPCAATASFTTTSQNMAIITAIISPVPPLNSDETPTTAATPVSAGSVNFDDKLTSSSISDTSGTAPSIEKNVTDTPPIQASPDDSFSVEKEKENIFTNEADISSSSATTTVVEEQPSNAVKSPVAVDVSPARPEPVVAKNKSRDSVTGSRKSHRNNNKNASSRRGRGRGRGRGRNRNANCFYRELDDDIHSKLVGTVYDFDDEDDVPGDNLTNLKAMRERRKSTDTAYCDRFSTSSKDTCYSPKFASPSSQPPSKRKSSVASTPDRRSSHRSQLSPLCEISNSVRVTSKDTCRDGQLPLENDEDEDDEVAEEEEDEEDEITVEKKSGNSVCIPGGKHDRNITASSSSPTLAQPPVQSSAIEQFAAVQPVLPGPVDMRTYSGDTSFEIDSQLSGFDPTASAKNQELASDFATSNSVTDSFPDIEDALEKEIKRYSSIPATVTNRGAKYSPAASVSPRILNDSSKLAAPYTSPNHFLGDQLDNVHAESSSVLFDEESLLSRNQLKMKIKGPYSNANYVPVTTSNINAVNQQLPSASQNVANDACYATVAGTLNPSASSAVSSSNLPRMRKKELLLQYCSNINEGSNNVIIGNPHSGVAGDANSAPVKSGPSYKLPKAVASMTTIPTKEDYKAVLDAAFIDKKKRGKDKSSSSSSSSATATASVVYDASDISNNNNNSNSSTNNNNNSNVQNNNKHGVRSPDRKYPVDDYYQHSEPTPTVYDNHSTKRKSRSSASSSVTHPKLKIKIGGGAAPVVVQNSVGPTSSIEEKNLRLRPPKKRLCDSNDMQPSPAAVEQLKRECMRYGSKIRSEFNENGDRYEGDGDYSDTDDNIGLVSQKTSTKDEVSRKKRKRSSANNSEKSSKRRKKQQKLDSCSDNVPKAEVVRVITNDVGGEGAPKKLIIKFRNLNPSNVPPASSSSSSPPPPPPPIKPPKSSKRNLNHELDSVRTTKITPIRLKLSRSLKGYVSKTSCADEETSIGTVASSDPSSMLPNVLSRLKTVSTHPSENSSADVAATASTSMTISTTATAAVCVSDVS